MVIAKEIFQILENCFPLWMAEDWDNVGLQLGSVEREVRRVMVALDVDRHTINLAREEQIDLLITHHPLFFRAVKSIDLATAQGEIIRNLIGAGITVYSAHTNLDAAPGGLNQFLAERLGLYGIAPFRRGREEVLYKLVVYVPRTHSEEVRKALCDSGAGHIGNYSDCTFRVEGVGTFKPLEGTNPFIGKTGKVEKVEEHRLETVVPQTLLDNVLRVLFCVHPYEEVAYDLYRLGNQGRIFSPGRLGYLPKPCALSELAREVKRCLGLDYVLLIGDEGARVEKVGVAAGSGASFLHLVRAEGVDVLVTGDMKYHDAREAEGLGLSVIDAGHFGTERSVVDLVAGYLEREMAARGWEVEVIKAISTSPFKYL